MMCSFLFFLLHPLFFLLSRKVSHFTLSHIWRYTGVQERSLGFARDDDMGKTTFQTCPLYEAKDIHSTFVRLRPPFPSFRAQSRNPPCTLFFLAPFAEGFQFYFVTHTTLYRCAKFESRDQWLGIRFAIRENRQFQTFAALLIFMRRTTTLNPST